MAGKKKSLVGKVWLVAHPTHQYVEDVKDEAAKARLTIVDKKYEASIPKEFLASDTPKLTKKNKPKK